MDTAVAPDAGEIDLAAVWHSILRHKILVIAFGVLCALAAAIYALTATPLYRAQAVITEVPPDRTSGGLGSGSGAGLAGQLAGAASLVGLNIGLNGNDKESRAVLRSRHLVQEFIVRNNLLPTLSAGARKPLTLWKAVNQFQHNILDIREDMREGTTTVRIEWKDPATAALWANNFVALANELLRTRSMDESKRDIAYLKAQVPQTTDVELQRGLYDLIEGETKNLMVASGRIEYAFTNVDPAVAPEIRSFPMRSLITLAGLFIGLIIGGAAALLRDRLRGARANAAGR